MSLKNKNVKFTRQQLAGELVLDNLIGNFFAYEVGTFFTSEKTILIPSKTEIECYVLQHNGVPVPSADDSKKWTKVGGEECISLKKGNNTLSVKLIGIESPISFTIWVE